MFPSKRPSTLASFAYTWVGGDIHGLSALAGTLYGYLAPIDGVITAVNATAADLVSAGGWSGEAASAFTNAWDADARGALGLGAAIEVIGDTVDSLAVRLAELESELETAADRVAAAGVAVNPDGSPGAVTLHAIGAGLLSGPAMAAAQGTAASYGALRQRILDDARQARLDAATTLENLYQQLAPGSGHGSNAASASIADQLRSFWSVSAGGYGVNVGQEVTGLASAGAAARTAWLAAGGAVAEVGNASWVPSEGGATLASVTTAAGAVAGLLAAGQNGQPWYEGVSEDSLASVTDATLASDVGAGASGALSFVSGPVTGASVGAAADGFLAAGIGRTAGQVLGEDGDEGAGESVGRGTNRLWNRPTEPGK